jgi:hypothetical protein
VFAIAILEIMLGIAISVAVVLNKNRGSAIKNRSTFSIKHRVGSQSLAKDIELLEKAEALNQKLKGGIGNVHAKIASALMLSGVILLAVSVVFSLSIVALIGLGIIFWGIIFLLTKPTKYVGVSLLDATTIPLLENIDHMITGLGYRGTAIYLPPRHIKALKGGMVFIPSKEDFAIPLAKEVTNEKIFIGNPNGICLIPPGLELTNLYESELGEDFVRVDISYLQDKLPKLFIEDLEIAEDLEISLEGNMIRVKIKGSICENLCRKARKLSTICNSIGCPLCSSLALALSRATARYIIIKENNVFEESRVIEIGFQMIEV